MRDPITKFPYPPEWVAACTDPAGLDAVSQGLAVLCSSGKILYRGYTTGTTAASACKAAVLSLRSPVGSVTINLPSGLAVKVNAVGKDGIGTCRKFSGDYPEDVTADCQIVASARITRGIRVLAGEGIGRFVRDTPRYPQGAPAISPSARELIVRSIHESLDEIGEGGVVIELKVVGGEAIAHRTLNPRVGVEGGISILGTTGLVEPWDDHLEESTMERVARSDRVVLTTGRRGLEHSRRLFPDHETVLVGVHMDNAIKAAKGEVVLCGLPALILKFLDPDILVGSDFGTVDELRSSPEWEERMSAALRKGRERYPKVRTVIVDREGSVLGDSG